MLEEFGIGAPDVLPDIFIMVNPCILDLDRKLPSCKAVRQPGGGPA